MKKLAHSLLMLGLGVAIGLGAMLVQRPEPLKAGNAHGNDKFSMCTVPISPRESEAVFVLDHLTGVLRGGWVNGQAGTFTHTYLRNVAADFNLNPATPEPKYAIVSGGANVQAGGRTQVANGVIYVGELTSGTVVAYGFAMPTGRGSAVPLELVRIGGFSFREAVGG